MDIFTKGALWDCWKLRSDEVKPTNEKTFNLEEKQDDEQEIGESFRIETNLFNYETSLCEKFKEFNYLLKIDPDVLTSDIVGFKTYDVYKDDWIYEWNKIMPWPLNYKKGCSEWSTSSWRDNGYCNRGNLPGAYVVGNMLHYQDLEWYDALKDSELKEEALRNKAIIEGLINEDVESNNEDDERYELCGNETHELPIYNVRRSEIIKYSFGQDKEYVAVKEDEYKDLKSTSKDACQAYQKIFRMMDEGWMEDMAYLCLRFTKDHKGNKIQYAVSRKDQYAVFKPYAQFEKKPDKMTIWLEDRLKNQDHSVETASGKLMTPSESHSDDVWKFVMSSGPVVIKEALETLAAIPIENDSNPHVLPILHYNGSISTWKDLTTCFLAQFFPPRRTSKLCNDILMFQQHQGESLAEAWTRFKDLLQKVPHHGIDLWLKIQIFYNHVNPIIRRTIDQAAGVKAISMAQDILSTSGRRLIKLENQVQHMMEAHIAPNQSIQVNKIASSCKICSGPHDTQYCIENLEQAFVEYASSCIEEAGGALPSDTIKNLKLNPNSTSYARSYPTGILKVPLTLSNWLMPSKRVSIQPQMFKRTDSKLTL
nr:zinc finger, CCHC-type [Tanacetum cinerariifolium]